MIESGSSSSAAMAPAPRGDGGGGRGGRAPAESRLLLHARNAVQTDEARHERQPQHRDARAPVRGQQLLAKPDAVGYAVPQGREGYADAVTADAAYALHLHELGEGLHGPLQGSR